MQERRRETTFDDGPTLPVYRIEESRALDRRASAETPLRAWHRECNLPGEPAMSLAHSEGELR